MRGDPTAALIDEAIRRLRHPDEAARVEACKTIIGYLDAVCNEPDDFAAARGPYSEFLLSKPGLVPGLIGMLRGSEAEAAVALRALRGLMPLGVVLGSSGFRHQELAPPASSSGGGWTVRAARGLMPTGVFTLNGSGTMQHLRFDSTRAATPASSFAAITAAAPGVLRRLGEHMAAWRVAGAGQNMRDALRVVRAACEEASPEQYDAIHGVSELRQPIRNLTREAYGLPLQSGVAAGASRLQMPRSLSRWSGMFQGSASMTFLEPPSVHPLNQPGPASQRLEAAAAQVETLLENAIVLRLNASDAVFGQDGRLVRGSRPLQEMDAGLAQAQAWMETAEKQLLEAHVLIGDAAAMVDANHTPEVVAPEARAWLKEARARLAVEWARHVQLEVFLDTALDWFAEDWEKAEAEAAQQPEQGVGPGSEPREELVLPRQQHARLLGQHQDTPAQDEQEPEPQQEPELEPQHELKPQPELQQQEGAEPPWMKQELPALPLPSPQPPHPQQQPSRPRPPLPSSPPPPQQQQLSCASRVGVGGPSPALGQAQEELASSLA